MSSSSVLGTLVVRIAAEIRKYQADLNTAAKDTEAAAGKIGKSSDLASQAAARMGGGMGEAARAAQGLHAAGGLAGLGVGALAVGIGAAAYAAFQGSKEQRAYERALIMSGNAAGVTAGQLADMAASIDQVVGTQAGAAAALAQMASTGEVAAGNLQKFSQTAIEMERAVGQSVGDTVKHFAELGREPVKASIKLNESLNYLTASTFAQIKAAQDLGDTERAADIAQNAYADAMKSRAAQIEQSAGYIERAWRGVRDVAKEAWDSMLGLGRQSTANEQLAAVQKRLEGLRFAQAQGFGNSGSGRIAAAETEKSIRMLEAQAAALGGVAQSASEAAKAQADKAAQDKAGIKWTQDGNQYMDRAAKLNQKMVEITLEGVKAGASQAEIDRRIGIEREKAAEKGVKAYKAAATEAERMAAAGEKLAASLLAQDSGLSGDFAQKWDQLGAAYKAGGISLEKLVAAQAALLAQQPGIKAAAEATAKAELAAAQARDKHIESLAGGLAKLEEDVARQREHNAQIGLGREALADLTAARLEDQAAMLEGQAIKAMDRNLDMAQYELLMSQARALRELAALKREGGAAQAAVDAAKDATKAWDKFAEQVNQSLSDALMDAFMAGKGFGQTFVNSIKSMFNSMVLRPVISAIVGGATGSLGFSGAANAASSGGSLLSTGADLLGMGSSLAGVGSFMGQLGTGLLASAQSAIGMTATAAQASYAASMGVAAQTGSLMGSLGPLISAAPYLLAIAGVYMLAKKLDNSGTPHTGGGSQYSAAGGLLDARSSVFASGFTGIAYSDSTTQMTAGLVQSIVAILDSTATAFGQKAGYTAAASFADDSSRDGAWGSLRIADALGRVLTDWQAGGVSFRTFSDGSAGSAEYLAAISADVKQALDRIDLPAWARKTVDALGDAPSLEQMAAAVQQITAIQNAIAGQRAGLQQQLDLLTGVTTQREIERNALDESNRALYDQIMALQDQKAATEAAAEAARAVAAERAGLQQQLDLLTGVTTQREIERNALDESNRALYDQITALQDQKAAAEEAAKAEAAAAEVARAVAQERTGLENALLQALGETATLRQRELAGLNPANRALQEQVYAVNDAKEAIASLTSDIARLDQIARQAASLSNRIGVMLGGTDNTEAGLWATVNNASATAEDRLGAIGELVGVINNRITTDTQEAQRVLTEGAQQAQQAIEAANAAQQAGANAQLEAAQKMADLGQQLRDYVQGLRLGSSSTLTPGQRLALAAQQYQQSLSGARAGDEKAMGALQGNASAYLDLARQYDAAGYNRVFADVTGALDSFGGSLMTEGQQQAATAQATLASIKTVSASTAATTDAVLAGNVISDQNRQALETLLGMTTQIQADAAIEKAAKQAQVTAETNRMEAIRTSLSDAGVIALGVTSTAQVMTDFASQQKVDNAALLKQVAELTQRIADLEMNTVNALGGVAGVVQQAGSDNAQVVAQAVATAVSAAADKVVIA